MHVFTLVKEANLHCYLMGNKATGIGGRPSVTNWDLRSDPDSTGSLTGIWKLSGSFTWGWEKNTTRHLHTQTGRWTTSGLRSNAENHEFLLLLPDPPPLPTLT